MSASALEGLLDGLWAIHPSRLTALGNERCRRRPKRHIAFDASGWRLFETAFRRRFGSCGVSQGVWSVVTVDAGALLVLTVNTCRHPRAYRAALGSSYGYGGGALVGMGARAYREREGRRQRAGQAKMYFLPVELQDQSIVVTLPSDGRSTPMQRWVRVHHLDRDICPVVRRGG
jgi:hypothetical protein